MKGWLAGEEVEKGGIVRLDDEEEDLFGRYMEQGGAHDGIFRICPDSAANEV